MLFCNNRWSILLQTPVTLTDVIQNTCKNSVLNMEVQSIYKPTLNIHLVRNAEGFCFAIFLMLTPSSYSRCHCSQSDIYLVYHSLCGFLETKK